MPGARFASNSSSGNIQQTKPCFFNHISYLDANVQGSIASMCIVESVCS